MANDTGDVNVVGRNGRMKGLVEKLRKRGSMLDLEAAFQLEHAERVARFAISYPTREETKRQIFADPRFYERGYMKIISNLYGVHPNTVHKYRMEERRQRK